ncbi:MAG TPA: FecR family protein [Flavobacteriales bacterium]|nr:FecR family protein [Flavobacteriales bacterium]
MRSNENHINREEESLFQKLEVPYNESKEQIWDKLSEKINAPAAPVKETKIIPMHWFKMAAAAAAVLLFGVSLFFGLYTHTIHCPRGEHLAYTLPDGSTIEMNAASKLSYHPFWWSIKRTVSLEGEAFFSVKKGSTFTVVSEKGTTQVLGTSFNISTRNNQYEVFCATGKVRVAANNTSEEIILSPNMFARINGKLEVVNAISAEHVLAWKENKFHFTARTLQEVFNEIERQYDITVQLDVDNATELTYTGHFKRSKTPEEVLNLICHPFGFTFVKQENDNYKVSQN